MPWNAAPEHARARALTGPQRTTLVGDSSSYVGWRAPSPIVPFPLSVHRPLRDGTQRTSSRGAVGWRRVEARGRTLHAIEESAARLVVAGPLWARNRAGCARPSSSTSGRPWGSPAPVPPFHRSAAISRAFPVKSPQQRTRLPRQFPLLVAQLRVLIRDPTSLLGERLLLIGTERASVGAPEAAHPRQLRGSRGWRK